MLYPLYVHKDPDSAYSGIFPDFPGCFTAADELQDLPASAQEAVTAHFGSDDDPIPAPSSPQEHLDDPDLQGGFWLLVDIDLDKVRPKSVRLNISLPQTLVQQIDAYARQHGATRSGFLAEAARQAMRQGASL